MPAFLFVGLISPLIINKNGPEYRTVNDWHLPADAVLESVFRRDSKFLASVTAAGSQNTASVRCRHALAEAMFVTALAL